MYFRGHRWYERHFSSTSYVFFIFFWDVLFYIHRAVNTFALLPFGIRHVLESAWNFFCLYWIIYLISVVNQFHMQLVCSTPLLAPRIGLYTASLVSLKDALIGWSASDYDAPIQLWRIQINTGYTLPSPTWRTSPTWRKQKAFPLPGTAALWVF